MKSFNHQVSALDESIFSQITRLANTHNAINLAQGFPDFEGPDWVLDVLQKSFLHGKNQYAPSMGLMDLREQISLTYKKFYQLNYDPLTEILITNGATEAIYATIMALINPGDEVIAFEPLYDSYIATVKMAGGVLKPVTLHYPEFEFNPTELKQKITDKTKLLILNNPHNPTGRVFTKEELQLIADLANQYDFYILSDEVYEFLTFEQKHIPIATYKNLKNRVLTISSIGKTLSLTGWKVGWVCAAPNLIKVIHNVHQFATFCVAHPLQAVLAKTWSQLDAYIPQLQKEYLEKRNFLTHGLQQLGYKVIVPQGAYFILAKTLDNKSDLETCKDLITNKKVATIPTSVFYLQSQEGKSLIRFCFAKKISTLNKALELLQPTTFSV